MMKRRLKILKKFNNRVNRKKSKIRKIRAQKTQIQIIK